MESTTRLILTYPRAALGSEGAAARQHGGQSPQQDAQVEPDRPALEVEEVQADEVVEVELAAPRDLPQPRDPGQDKVALAVPVLEALVIAQGQRARPDQRHLSHQDVEQLWELVERIAPEQAPDRRQAGVTADLEQGAAGLVERFEVGLALIGVGIHGPELQACE